MEEREKSMETLCSFYVSDWHIVTMLLPYINAQINENKKVKSVYLLNSDEEQILNFFNSVGKLDLNGEICNIENNKAVLNLKLKEKEQNNLKYGPLSKKLGALLGILLFIIFV